MLASTKSRSPARAANHVVSAVAFALALATSARAGFAPSRPEEIVREAIESSLRVKAAGRALAIAEAELENAGAALLPSASLDSSHGLEARDPKSATSPWTSSLDLHVEENLYDNGQSWARRRAARLLADAAKLDFDAARNQAALDALERIYDYSVTRAALAAKEKQAENYRKQLALIEKLVKQGQRPRKDWVRFDAETRRAEIAVLSAKSDVELARVAIEELLARAGSVPIEIEPAQPPNGETTAQIDRGAQHVGLRPTSAPRESSEPGGAGGDTVISGVGPVETLEERAARLRSEAAAIRAEAKRRLRWPEAFLTTGAGYSNSSYLGSGKSFDANHVVGWNAALELRYSLWDWGIRRREGEIEGIREKQAEDAELKVRVEKDSRRQALLLGRRTALASLDLNRRLLASEKEAYALIETEYHEGKVSYLDIVSSLGKLLDAELLLSRSRFAVMRADAGIQALRGTLAAEYEPKETQ